MSDTLTHFKRLMNPLYLGAYEFQPNEEKTVTIAYVREERVMGADGKSEDCIVAHFQEKDLKPMILNVTNCKAIAKLYKTPYIEEWVGKRLVLRVQPVKAFGEVVDAVRIKPEIPKAAPSAPVCEECAQILKPFGKMNATQLAAYTKQKYGRVLCADCAKGQIDAAENKAEENKPEQPEQKEETKKEQ